MKLSQLFKLQRSSDPSTDQTLQGDHMSSTTPTDPQLNQLIDSVIANTQSAQDTATAAVEKVAKPKKAAAKKKAAVKKVVKKR